MPVERSERGPKMLLLLVHTTLRSPSRAAVSKAFAVPITLMFVESQGISRALFGKIVAK